MTTVITLELIIIIINSIKTTIIHVVVIHCIISYMSLEKNIYLEKVSNLKDIYAKIFKGFL